MLGINYIFIFIMKLKMYTGSSDALYLFLRVARVMGECVGTDKGKGSGSGSGSANGLYSGPLGERLWEYLMSGWNAGDPSRW